MLAITLEHGSLMSTSSGSGVNSDCDLEAVISTIWIPQWHTFDAVAGVSRRNIVSYRMTPIQTFCHTFMPQMTSLIKTHPSDMKIGAIPPRYDKG